MADEEKELTQAEWREESHPYEDHNGWCAKCGRSEGFKAHASNLVTSPLSAAPVAASVSEAATVEDRPKARRGGRFGSKEESAGE